AARSLPFGPDRTFGGDRDMHAIKLLRGMHAETRVQFKNILGTDDPQLADQAWRALQPVLKLHQEIEDRFVYQPLQEESLPGTPLGDWAVHHDADVGLVERVILASGELTPGTRVAHVPCSGHGRAE